MESRANVRFITAPDDGWRTSSLSTYTSLFRGVACPWRRACLADFNASVTIHRPHATENAGHVPIRGLILGPVAMWWPGRSPRARPEHKAWRDHGFQVTTRKQHCFPDWFAWQDVLHGVMAALQDANIRVFLRCLIGHGQDSSRRACSNVAAKVNN